MKISRDQNQIHAGSMADIAFLLLIFFLVSTVIPNDEGINRKLPKDCKEPCEIKDFHERNVLRVLINNENQILIEDDVVALNEVRNIARDFIDNNLDGSCSYCQGKQEKTSSDRPSKAIISLQSGRETSYGSYIAVQNELVGAYNTLRSIYAARILAKNMDQLSEDELKELREVYPQIISEAKTNY